MSRYCEEALTQPHALETSSIPHKPLPLLVSEDLPAEAHDRIGPYLEEARLLGLRTGEIHTALASAEQDEQEFVPEPFTDFYHRGLYQGMLGTANLTLPLLRHHLKRLPEPTRRFSPTSPSRRRSAPKTPAYYSRS